MRSRTQLEPHDCRSTVQAVKSRLVVDLAVHVLWAV